MDILKSLMGNKSILNGALGMLKSAFLKDGITAVFITPSDDENSETPGMKIQSYRGPVAILTGEELVEVQEYFKVKAMCSKSPGYFLFLDDKLTYLPNSAEAFEEFKAFKESALREPKEVDRV